jgi:hypothetical protein
MADLIGQYTACRAMMRVGALASDEIIRRRALMSARANACLGAVTLLRRLGRGAAALLLAAIIPIPATAQDQVDLNLVLAVDASGSVDFTRFELQRRGYVAAFRNSQVLQAIRGGANQSIAVAMFQWTGPRLQAQIVPWTLVRDDASANSVATLIETTPRRLFGGGTSISGAIDYAMRLFSESRLQDARRVIDVSGDGSNNSGRRVTSARDEAVAADVVINGLPILAWEPYLDNYYKDNVIGGPGAFMIVAQTFDTFADAILKKMIIEISATPPKSVARRLTMNDLSDGAVQAKR